MLPSSTHIYALRWQAQRGTGNAPRESMAQHLGGANVSSSLDCGGQNLDKSETAQFMRSRVGSCWTLPTTLLQPWQMQTILTILLNRRESQKSQKIQKVDATRNSITKHPTFLIQLVTSLTLFCLMSILAAEMLGPGEILDCLWLSERAGSSESRRGLRGLLMPRTWWWRTPASV